ncbi:UBX protein [Geosmithia morbida]|uniref:UBX protein n=1 Tax=Geosmithia morbida TaxID=1094350 RepID=A0A9P5D6I3_9HYPO|nr:UBX protein [Geosmithia morbida]KAF4124790.1 UBX protein [Geosmithia morbida]
MFYQGSLQEGISTAVGQQKLVLCFVTGTHSTDSYSAKQYHENDESQKWENDSSVFSKLNTLIKNQAVALRLRAGSEEAGYLAQIFPLPQTPTVVIIKNGELKEYITPGVSQDDFTRRIHTAFSAQPTTASQHQEPSSSSPAQTQNDDPPPTRYAQESEQSENVRRVLAERAARLQAEKEEAERKAKEERAKAKERAKAEAEAGADSDAARAHKQAELLKKRKKKEDSERRRILQRIEADREERRQVAAERRRQRASGGSERSSVDAMSLSPDSRTTTSSSRLSSTTALQIRLFDGSTMRSRFPTESTTLKDVRRWVDEGRNDGALPYTFKQVLTPMPNRNIDETEESRDLGDLQLSPSSTLVLIPVQRYASAYGGGAGPDSNLFVRIIRLLLGSLAWILAMIGLGGVGARASHEPTSSQRQSGGDTPPQVRHSRVAGFQNPEDRRRDQQLYNGNSLNFEPNPDDEEKR